MNRRNLLLFLGYLSLVFFVSTRPGLTPPGPGFHMKDKVAHVAEYAVMGGLLAAAFGGVVRSSRVGAFLLLLAVGAAIGALDETLQGYTPDRTMSVYDWIADVAGLAAVLALFVARRRYQLERKTGGELP